MRRRTKAVGQTIHEPDELGIPFSAWKPSRFPAELAAYLRGHGRKKVLFGSNWPMLAPGACLAEVDALNLDEEARRLYLHENAARVFRLDA